MPDESDAEFAPKPEPETSRGGSNRPPRRTAVGYSGGGSGSGGFLSGSGGAGGSEDWLHQLNQLLAAISVLPGVEGSTAIRFDGMLICTDLPHRPRDLDLQWLSTNAVNVHNTTRTSIKKLGHHELFQLALKTSSGYIYIADFSSRLLITLVNTQELRDVIEVIKTVRAMIGERT